jgi:hypothetical protein
MELVMQEQPKAAAMAALRGISVQILPRNLQLAVQAITLLEIPLPALNVQLDPTALPLG